MSIVLDKVSKSIGNNVIVNDISLEIQTGELFVLLGASGSGKSTLLRLIAGLTQPDGGRIWLHDRDVTFLPPQKRNTGFVFQNYSLFRHMTVRENIEFALDIRRVSQQVCRERVADLLALIGMEDLADRKPAQLSGGQQQRVALARALAHQPEVLLLDEPFGALDAKIRLQLRQNLREIQQQLQITTILVTHDQDEAFELADRIGVIHQGALLEVGSASTLYHYPQTHFTATFLGNANLLPGHRHENRVYLRHNSGGITLTAPANTEYLREQPVMILSRPEEVQLALESQALQGHVIGYGTVEQTTFAGSVEKIAIHLPSYEGDESDNITIQALLSADEAENIGIEIGRQVWVALRDFHLLPYARG